MPALLFINCALTQTALRYNNAIRRNGGIYELRLKRAGRTSNGSRPVCLCDGRLVTCGYSSCRVWHGRSFCRHKNIEQTGWQC